MGVQRVQREESEASGDKNCFSKIMDLTSQTLLIDCFYSFAEDSPPMSVHNLSHLKCTTVGERTEKTEKWSLSGSWEEPNRCLGFPRALTFFNL